MKEKNPDIIEQYFKSQENCNSIDCQKVIFEPEKKREWFYEDDAWCYFDFLCEDMDYRLVMTEQKTFAQDCEIRDMSYEIKMLLSYFRLRNTKIIAKELLSTYIINYEKEKQLNQSHSVEKYNLDLKQREDEALEKSSKIANKILIGCLGIIAVMFIAFTLLVVIPFFSSKAEAKSKYTQEFIQHFYQCKPYKETKFNTAYNSQSTYEIKGYTPDGSGKCIYVETNAWLKGTNITTCYFDTKNHREYFNAMIAPDKQGSVLVKGMPVVGKNEEVTYLKYFNNPKVCRTQSIYN